VLYNVNIDLENSRGSCMVLDYMTSEEAAKSFASPPERSCFFVKVFAKKVAANRIGVEL